MSEIYGTFSTAYVEAMRLRLSALEAENKGLAAHVAELVAENKTLRDRFSDADTERNAAQAALKAAFARVEELEARTHEAEESNANALARLSAAEARIELRRIENEAARHQVWHAENVCDAMEKRVFDTEARCKRMQEIGDMIVDEYMVEKAEKDAWEQAKEARP